MRHLRLVVGHYRPVVGHHHLVLSQDAIAVLPADIVSGMSGTRLLPWAGSWRAG
jgi:hypothetical protein